MTDLVRLAGLAQLVLAIASALIVPRALGWRADLAHVTPLTRAIFWTYAGYISVINASFGFVSLLAPDWLVARTPLAAAVCAFIAVYWGARVIIQFAYYDRVGGRPVGTRYLLGEVAVVVLFAVLAVVYSAAAIQDAGGLTG